VSELGEPIKFRGVDPASLDRLEQDSGSIDAGMDEAAEKAKNAMDAAVTQLVTGQVGGDLKVRFVALEDAVVKLGVGSSGSNDDRKLANEDNFEAKAEQLQRDLDLARKQLDESEERFGSATDRAKTEMPLSHKLRLFAAIQDALVRLRAEDEWPP
jgi:hypothetical protein